MYLYSRTRTMNTDHAPEALALAVEAGNYITKLTGLTISVWSTVYGAPLGTIGWSTRVESQAAMGAAQEKLVADAGYQKLVAKAAQLFQGPAEDVLSQFVAMAGTGQVGNFVTVTGAECAPGKIADAMAWGVDVMNHVHTVTGRDVAMVRGVYGAFATVGWVASAATLAEVDAANDAISADTTYVKRVDEGGSLFQSGSASSRLLRKIG